ncbi:MAG: hypothetical protein V7L31_25935 [Nostoc sp.]|uniref:hypothetical protein n=1 Tax=Nostoc sp. TaxID=1180 RepID=UPI002FF168F5
MNKISQTIPIFLLSTSLVVFLPKICAAFSLHQEFYLALASINYPIVKSAGLSPDMDVPWSKPVRVSDPFEGGFLAVFDRNYLGGYLYNQGSKQIISLWTHKDVRVLVTVNSGLAGSFDNIGFLYNGHFDFHRHFYSAGLTYPRPDYLQLLTTKKVTKFLLKVGEQVYQLEGTNNTFAINNKLAVALKNAPYKNLNIRLMLEGGQTVDSEIGKETVKAWQIIY